jgi:TonB family protein
MLDVLIASAAHHQVRAHWVTTSTITHALLIALAVSVTRGALENPPPLTADPAILLFVPKPPPPPPQPELKREPVVQPTVVAEPPPKGFQTVVAPRDIPDMIPPVDLTQRPLDPRDFTGRGVEGGVATGVVGGTGVVDPSGGDLNAIYEATTQDDRFEQAVVVLPPAPRYPALLGSAGIEGEVSVEFVIDTLGRVEGASIRILHSTHEAFESSARAAMAAAVFRPARLRERPVRQLSRQSIRFVAAY